MKKKLKLMLNVLILIGILAIMYYLLQSSWHEIIAQLRKTSGYLVIAILLLGTLYLLLDGKSVKAIVNSFERDFQVTDGFFAVCYVAFYRIVTFGAGTIISEVNFYRKKGLKLSQGIGVTALHMVMYKLAVLTYAVAGLVIQFSLFYHRAPKLIWGILAGMIITFLIIAILVAITASVNVQVLFVVICDKLFKTQKFRDIVDKCNHQIYSLRETIYCVLRDRTAFAQIYIWNLLKLVPWYVIPYLVLVQEHPNIDFLLTVSFVSFAVILSGVLPTPAGIGSFEFVYMLLFKPLVGTVDAVSSMLLYRFASFIWPFVMGFFYVILEKRKALQADVRAIKEETES